MHVRSTTNFRLHNAYILDNLKIFLLIFVNVIFVFYIIHQYLRMANSKFSDLEKKLEKKISSLSTEFNEIKNILSTMQNYVVGGKDDLEKIKKLAVKYESISSDIVKINVGGTYFSTLKTTLEKRIKNSEEEYHEPNLLQSIISGIIKINYDENKAIFIDRNPKYFGYILDYLRNVDSSNPFNVPKLTQENIQEFQDEAVYFGLHGLIELLDPKLDSVIIKSEENNKFFSLINEKGKWKRLYRASSDGFQITRFHAKCDGIPNTLTIIKSTLGYVFGGFSPLSWDQSGAFKNDKNAFIFSFLNASNKPCKINCTNPTNSIYCHSSYGPTFGGGHDIYIANNSNQNSTSYSNLCHSYALTGYTNATTQADSFLAGAYNFQVTEIEVFQKTG